MLPRLKLTKQAINVTFGAHSQAAAISFAILFSKKEERKAKLQRLSPPGWNPIKSLGVGGA